MSSPILRALVVGINEFLYQKNLSGCVNDAQNMATYLAEHISEPYQPDIKLLKNAEVSRDQLINSFREHLITPAQDGDIILFYFSGHGGQELADQVFHLYESDRLLEGLVCHDSGKGGKPLLVDKEIRYLMAPLKNKNCHVVTIFDCCHAGDITREQNELPERRISSRSKARDWSEFVFAKDPKFAEASVFSEQHLDDLLPEVKHIQFTACQDFESAYEHPTRHYGFFTHSLLATLNKSGGQISYFELQRRIRAFMRVKKLKQSPHLYTPKGQQQEVMGTFLSGTISEKPITGHVAYDALRKNWTVNLGGIHGLTVDGENEAPSLWVDLGEDEYCEARIEEVFSSYSKIEFEPYANVVKREMYLAYISSLLLTPTKIYLKGESAGLAAIEAYSQAHEEELKKNQISFCEHEKDDIYILEADKQAYYLYFSSEKEVPLIEEIRGYGPQSVAEVMKKILHISRWLSIRNLKNVRPTFLSEQAIQLKVFPSKGSAIVYHPETEFIALTPAKNKEDGLKYSFQLKNQTNYELYVACLYMNRLFAIEVDYLSPNVIRLDPGHTVMALNGRQVSLSILNYIEDFNLPEEVLYFKIIASTQPFEVNLFALPALKQPQLRGQALESKGFDLEGEIGGGDGWITQLIEFHLKNPFYQQR